MPWPTSLSCCCLGEGASRLCGRLGCGLAWYVLNGAGDAAAAVMHDNGSWLILGALHAADLRWCCLLGWAPGQAALRSSRLAHPRCWPCCPACCRGCCCCTHAHTLGEGGWPCRGGSMAPVGCGQHGASPSKGRVASTVVHRRNYSTSSLVHPPHPTGSRRTATTCCWAPGCTPLYIAEHSWPHASCWAGWACWAWRCPCASSACCPSLFWPARSCCMRCRPASWCTPLCCP